MTKRFMIEAKLIVETVQVSLTPQEQVLFLEFRKRQKNLTKMLNSGMFDIRNGYAVVHFDSNSVVGAIERHDKLTT